MGAVHSSDSFYLQNATSTYNNETLVNVAQEWRAYLSSFIQHGEYVASICSPHYQAKC